jgi:hypothetical protein
MIVVYGKELWVSHNVHLKPRGIIGNRNFNISILILKFVKFYCLLTKTVRSTVFWVIVPCSLVNCKQILQIKFSGGRIIHNQCCTVLYSVVQCCTVLYFSFRIY